MAISRADARANRLMAAKRARDDVALKAEVKADAFVNQFIGMTPQQVVDYVNAQAKTLAGARQLLGKMAVMLLLLAKREYGD